MGELAQVLVYLSLVLLVAGAALDLISVFAPPEEIETTRRVRQVTRWMYHTQLALALLSLAASQLPT